MFTGSEKILELINVFQERKVSLFHACQLKDLQSYLKIGGIPSRALLDNRGLPFTEFRSDKNDKKTEDWNRVFLNMSDFGKFFHSRNGSYSTPNVYGPILFELNPDCIEEAIDISICLRSAGSIDYDRGRFSLKSIEEVEKLFVGKKDSLKSSWVKNISDLQKEFKNIPVKSSPEISCTIETQTIKLDYITSVIVDPLSFNGSELYDSVASLLRNHHEILGTMVSRNSFQKERYSKLVDFVGKGHRNVNELKNSSDLGVWATKFSQSKHAWQFKRFADYLSSGTLENLKNVA